jgi:hypothetical protein
MPCIASWEAVEELGDDCPLCGRACYAHDLEEDRDAARAAAPSPRTDQTESES